MRGPVMLLLLSVSLLSAEAASEFVAEAHAMVPKGIVIEKNRRDLIVKTPAGSKIFLEFDRQNNFKEASGKNLNRGDDLEPGQGLISLSTAAQKAALKGRKLTGSWNLEQDKNLGWIYELEGEDQGQKVDYLIEAKSGKYLRSEERIPLSIAEDQL